MSKYQNLNPQSISELSVNEMRKAYSELRSIARKRADRLEAAGLPARRFAPLANVDAADLEVTLSEVAYYLRNPGSSLRLVKKEREQATLAARGYNITDFKEFGKFMDNFRYRFRNRKIPDSDIPAQIYDEAEKRNMTVKTLQREFGKYMSDQDDMRKLRDALRSAPERTRGSNRLTANNLKAILAGRK